ncbi:MAG: glycosyltransferase family 4 protein [Acidobacteria bacterium]|nr:glycosyltransferase family 4 protein [Acidobacteriota bacterium]
MTTLLRSPESLYAAYDRFPTQKGASTHIARFAPALFRHAGGGLLYVLGDSSMPQRQLEENVEIVRFRREIPNFLERAIAFQSALSRIVDAARGSLRIAHFRDPWSGPPLVTANRSWAAVYEVNALPSIELPNAFPSVAPRTLAKIRAVELHCLEACDAVVTPSRTTASMLERLGVNRAKITVIPNGADPVPSQPRPVDAPERYILYFGAMQRWQGVDTLLRAFARLTDLDELRLVVCGSARSRDARRLESLASKLGLSDRVVWQYELHDRELRPWLANAELSVAPLRECARNVEQGCAPLKIVESLAAGVPVVASNLPPVREIVTDGIEGRLVVPDRPADLARAIRVLLHSPQRREEMSIAARRRVEESLTWDHALAALTALYERLDSLPHQRGRIALRPEISIEGARA